MCTGECRHSDGEDRTGGHTYKQTLEEERDLGHTLIHTLLEH